MANNYFQFKKFKITQDRCAMKICTDACIFGAYVQPNEAERILDIGTGTGLLSLMIAQRSKAFIDAVEIDEEAFIQTRSNFQESPWSSSIKIYNCPVQEFMPGYSYDLIICNPPFFPNYLKSKDEKRNKALHNDSLSYEQLTATVKRLLSPDGIFWVLLPYPESLKFDDTAEKFHLKPLHRLYIRNKPGSAVFRTVSAYTFQKTADFSKAEICIKTENDEYSSDFKTLLKNYYLIF